MHLKNIVFLVVLLVYAGYFFGVSKGYIKKHSHYGKEGVQIGFIQQVIDVITPDSPEERRMKVSERLEVLEMQLAVAESNLESYKNWRANAIARPPA
jgi:hypothetical protein